MVGSQPAPCGDRDPIIRAARESKTRLIERHLPVWYRELPNRGRQDIDNATFLELMRKVDSQRPRTGQAAAS